MSKNMRLIIFFLIMSLVLKLKSIQVRTGRGNIYHHHQYVSLGYESITERNINIYFQYFKKLGSEGSSRRHIIFYLGNYLGNTAQLDAYLGIYPYQIFKNSDKKFGFDLQLQEKSLNNYTDIVGVDMVRGGGFSIDQSNRILTYDLIAEDLEIFIKRFIELESIDTKKTNLTIFAGYETAIPAITFTEKTAYEVNLILQNPWLGYSSISQLYLRIPAFGYTDRKTLDMVSNVIYSLQTSDYGKDFENMYSQIKDIREITNKKYPIDFNNPSKPQNNIYNILDSVKSFFKDCSACRAYCSLEKNGYERNDEIYQILQKSFIIDYSRSFFQKLKAVKAKGKKVLVLQGSDNIHTSLDSVIENSDPELIKNARNINNWIYIKELKGVGFHTLMDDFDTVIEVIKKTIGLD